jgi:hypothetical protein
MVMFMFMFMVVVVVVVTAMGVGDRELFLVVRHYGLVGRLLMIFDTVVCKGIVGRIPADYMQVDGMKDEKSQGISLRAK